MTDPTRIARLAFIGCGRHSQRKLLPSIPQLRDKIDLIAVCDLNAELAQSAQRWFGARRWYDDMDAMLSKEELDGVVVVGPPQMMSAVGEQVLQHGLPVFLEKPPALTSQAAEKLARLADAKSTFGQVAFMKRFAVGYRMAEHLVRQPEFGGVQMVEAKWSQGAYPPVWSIESAAVSFLTGQVIHLFDLVRHFGGDVARVYASFHEVSEAQFGFFVNLTFKSGIIGALNLNTLEARESWRDYEERLVVAGTENQVTVEDMVCLRHQSSQDWIEVPGLDIGRLHQTWRPSGPSGRNMEELIGYKGELEHFAHCVVSGEKPGPDLWEGVAALQLAEAVWQSVQSGAPVDLTSEIREDSKA